MNRPHILHELTRLLGLLARAVIESNHSDFIARVHDIRRICDLAIQQGTFRIPDDDSEVDDDEL